MSFPTDLVYFRASEFRYPDNMDVGFLRWLDRVRGRAGVPFHITNDYRTNGKGLHGRGMAVDLDSRQWSAHDKWRVNAAIVGLEAEAPGAIEFEPVYNADPAKDHHWHIGVDPRPNAVGEFVEADD